MKHVIPVSDKYQTIESSEGSEAVDLGWAVARLNYVVGWIMNGEFFQHRKEGEAPRDSVVLQSVIFMAPGEESSEASSVFVGNLAGLIRLRDALNKYLPKD